MSFDYSNDEMDHLMAAVDNIEIIVESQPHYLPRHWALTRLPYMMPLQAQRGWYPTRRVKGKCREERGFIRHSPFPIFYKQKAKWNG